MKIGKTQVLKWNQKANLFRSHVICVEVMVWWKGHVNNAKDEAVHAAKVPARKLIAVRIAKGVEKFSCGSIHHKNRKEVKE